MSAVRGDCEHGHAAEVLEMARVIGADHGLTVKGAALVCLAEDEEPVAIGAFNTRALWQMAAALLIECGKHEPDGCPTCDPSALAAREALSILRHRASNTTKQHI